MSNVSQKSGNDSEKWCVYNCMYAFCVIVSPSSLLSISHLAARPPAGGAAGSPETLLSRQQQVRNPSILPCTSGYSDSVAGRQANRQTGRQAARKG
jgi:hypothetical protein